MKPSQYKRPFHLLSVLAITSLLLSTIFTVGPVLPSHAKPRHLPKASADQRWPWGTTATVAAVTQQSDPYPKVATLFTDKSLWNYLIGKLTFSWLEDHDGACDIRFIPPAPDNSYLEVNTVQEFNHLIMFSPYSNRQDDGAQIRIYRNRARREYFVAIAGTEGGMSPLANANVQDMLENASSENSIAADYAQMILSALADATKYANEPTPRHAVAPGAIIEQNGSLILVGHSQGGNVAQLIGASMQNARLYSGYSAATNNAALNDVLERFNRHGIHLSGGVIAASRPHSDIVDYNRADPVKNFFTLQAERDDIVPLLGLASDNGWNSLLLIALLVDPLKWSYSHYAFEMLRDNVKDRVQLYFDDTQYTLFKNFSEIGMVINNAHNYSYVDPTLEDQGHVIGIVPPGMYPENTYIISKLPDPESRSWPLTLEYIGGYGYDCLSACPNAESSVAQSDGIPDKMWVSAQGDGKTRDLDAAQKEQSVRVWTNTGMNNLDHPYPLTNSEYTDWTSQNSAASAIHDGTGILLNRDFVKLSDYRKTYNLTGPTCSNNNNNNGTTYPGGPPDDYQAPWTYPGAGSITDEWLASLTTGVDLEPWSPAWNRQLQAALAPRITLAETQDKQAALVFYRYVSALSEWRAAEPMLSAQLVTPYDLDLLQNAIIAEQDLQDELELELFSGQRGEVPATREEILAYWRTARTTQPALVAWQNSALGQIIEAAQTPYRAAQEAYENLISERGETGARQQLRQQWSSIERQVKKQASVGLLEGGLANWAATAMAYSGVPTQRINPLTTSPYDAPNVLLVPSGALNNYQSYSWIRNWLEAYTASGGFLIVLAQAYGENWTLLPGGEVRGLGYEEDILCREESVQVLTLSPFLLGLTKEIPNLQVDGSFTQYPAPAEVLLNRRTGNQMPAMIQYRYGDGQVLATSLYPDYASVNGMQSGDDFPFTRSFFLEAWRQATGATIIDSGVSDQPLTLAVAVNNTTAVPVSQAIIASDMSAGTTPDVWRYKVHYDAGHETNSRIQVVTVPLNPPLQPAETRLVTATLPAGIGTGLHRLGINNIPGPLYLIDDGFLYLSPLRLVVRSDKATYWVGDKANLTISLRPSPLVTATQAVTLTSDYAAFPSQQVTVVPGEFLTITTPLSLDTALVGQPLKFQVLEAATGSGITDFSLFIGITPVPPPLLSLTIAAADVTTTTIPLTLTNLGGQGTIYTGTIALSDLDRQVLQTTIITGAIAGAAVDTHTPPPPQMHIISRSADLATQYYVLSYSLYGQEGQSWSGQRLFHLAGLEAELQVNTDHVTYLASETITTTSTLTANLPLSDTALLLQVVKPHGVTPARQFTIANSGLEIQDINATAADMNGNIWFAGYSYDGWLRLERFQNDLETWQSFSFPNPDGNFYPSQVNEIVSDHLGRTWFATDDGVAMLAANDVTWRVYRSTEYYPSFPADADGARLISGEPDDELVANDVYAVALDQFDNVWFGTSQGVSQLSIITETGTWTTYNTSNSGLVSDYINDLIVDDAGNIWFATSGNGVSQMSPDDTWTTWDPANSGLGGWSVIDMALDPAGAMWFATTNGDYPGLSVLQSDNRWITYTVENSELVSAFINAITIDAAGRKWIGYDADGISRLSVDNTTWHHFTSADLLSDDSIMDIATGPGEDVWLATRPYNLTGGATVFWGKELILREEWLAVQGNGPFSLDHALIYPPLAHNPLARGHLELRGTLYGPQPSATEVITQRQVLDRASAGFILLPDYDLALTTDALIVKLGEPLTLRGSVRNDSETTGLTLTFTGEGILSPTLSLPDLAPGATADFAIQAVPGVTGSLAYVVETPSWDTAQIIVDVLSPTVEVYDISPAAETVAWGGDAYLVAFLGNVSHVPAQVSLQANAQPPELYTILPWSHLTATLRMPVPEDAPPVWSVPVTITGDLSETRSVLVDVTAPGIGEAEIDHVVLGVGDSATFIPTTTVAAGNVLWVIAEVQPYARGNVLLQVTGFESHFQSPLLFNTLDLVTATVRMTVPTTLPGGVYPLEVRLGDQIVNESVTVVNWDAEMRLIVPGASVPAETLFPATVIVTETQGITASVLLSLRYDQALISHPLILLPFSTLTVTDGFTATLGAGRVTAFLGAQSNVAREAPYQPLIDSRPVNTHPQSDGAFVNLVITQTLTGTILAGELVISKPITQAALGLPDVWGGDLLLYASLVTHTAPISDSKFIDLNATPTGHWPFSVALPGDTPRGRYRLDFDVNGQWRPILFDLAGPQVVVHALTVDQTQVPTLTLTLNVESLSAITVTPQIFLQGQGLSVLSEESIGLHAGRQEVQLSTRLRNGVPTDGWLDVAFVTAQGHVIGGGNLLLQVSQANIVDAYLTGLGLGVPAEATVAMVGSGGVTLTVSELGGLLPATTTLGLTLEGYRQITIPLILASDATAIEVVLVDSRGHLARRKLLLERYVPDITLPTVTLLAPDPTRYETMNWASVTVTGTAHDSERLCSVLVNGHLADWNSLTGGYSTTLRLPPGVYSTTYALQAIAYDCGGNIASSEVQSVTVNRIYPVAEFVEDATTVVESWGSAPLTVTLNGYSSITTTLSISTSDGTALAGSDYIGLANALTLAPFQKSVTVTIPILQDNQAEPPETFMVTLSNPVHATLGAGFTTTVMIVVGLHRVLLPLVRR